jgi:hypothetical protein
MGTLCEDVVANSMLGSAVMCLSLRVCPPVAFAVNLQYPLLGGHYQRVAELPGIKEYLASPRRLEKVNNNNLG